MIMVHRRAKEDATFGAQNEARRIFDVRRYKLEPGAIVEPEWALFLASISLQGEGPQPSMGHSMQLLEDYCKWVPERPLLLLHLNNHSHCRDHLMMGPL